MILIPKGMFGTSLVGSCTQVHCFGSRVKAYQVFCSAMIDVVNVKMGLTQSKV